MTLKKLNHRHKAFIDEYIRCKNPAEAFTKVFGASNKRNYPYILLKDPLVREEITRRFKSLALTEDEIKALYEEIIHNKNEATKDRLHSMDSLCKVLGLAKDTTTEIHTHFDVIQEELVNKRLNRLQD